ncbi:MAG: hypothetical protein HQK53_18705, partial [Oligoflexia bacterium]|nr:hypothetical protein [Oligoflexia bacterium]
MFLILCSSRFSTDIKATDTERATRSAIEWIAVSSSRHGILSEFRFSPQQCSSQVINPEIYQQDFLEAMATVIAVEALVVGGLLSKELDDV